MTQLEIILERAIRGGGPVSLDSSALIAYLAGEEPQASFVTKLLESDAQIVVAAITASESFVRTVDTYGRDFAEEILDSLQESGRVLLVPFGRIQLLETAVIRSATRLKLADAAIVATARIAGAIALVGNDRAWKNKSLGVQYIHLDDVMRELEGESG